MKKCTEPDAPIVKCCICNADVHTCENPDGEINLLCPAHPDGCQLSDKRWVCSNDCYDKATGD